MIQGLPTQEELATRRRQMFPTLSDAELARVAAAGVEVTFEPGEILFEQGDANLPLYVVLEGELEIVHPCGDRETTITVHGPREFTGELNLLAGRRSLVRARARSRLRAIRVEQPRLKTLIQTDAELSEIFMRAFILRRVGLLSSGHGDVVVLGSSDSAETSRVRSFLLRNGHPARFVDVGRDPDVQQFLDEFRVSVDDIPVLICRGEVVLKNPTDTEIAECLGFNPTLDPGVVHDLVICGAGPGGLAAAVYAASEGLHVLLLERRAPGGQAAASSKIENYLGFPTGVSGQALAARALTQAEKFGAELLVARSALRVAGGDGALHVVLDGGDVVRALCVVIATGAEYRRPDVPGLDRFEGVGVHYAATFLEAQPCSGLEVVVVGGGNSAGQAATFLARVADRVHVLVRGPDLASSMSRYLIRRIEETPNIHVHRRTRLVAVEGGDHLESVTWQDDSSGERTTRAVRHLFVMTGARPNTDWLRGSGIVTDAHGFVQTGFDLNDDALRGAGWSLARRPHLFETSRPRIFAVGDVRAGSSKRLAAAVGEGSVCVQLVHRVLGE